MSKKFTSPWTWLPSLYFAQGFPYVIVMTVAVIMFKRLEMSNTDIALYTSSLYLPWVIKPVWSPLVDILKTKRWWIIVMQIVIGASLGCIALTLNAPDPFRYSMAFLWILAFSSATHDIAIDGFYMMAMDQKKQAYFVGIRNTFYRLAVIAGQGGLVMLAGHLEKHCSIAHAWSLTFYLASGIFFLLFVIHHFFLPHPEKENTTDTRRKDLKELLMEFIDTFVSFFKKEGIVPALTFILFYRFSEAQLAKITSPFLLDPTTTGGLGLSTTTVGFIYGTIGVVTLTAGGIIGGIYISRKGLRNSLWFMTCAMNIPNIVYLYMALAQPTNEIIISVCVAIEQLGYGFGFTSLTYFMILFSAGKQQTAHYAICTGIMALGMMFPGMISGWIQEAVGYQLFFTWIMLACIPSFIATAWIRRSHSIK